MTSHIQLHIYIHVFDNELNWEPGWRNVWPSSDVEVTSKMNDDDYRCCHETSEQIQIIDLIRSLSLLSFHHSDDSTNSAMLYEIYREKQYITGCLDCHKTKLAINHSLCRPWYCQNIPNVHFVYVPCFAKLKYRKYHRSLVHIFDLMVLLMCNTESWNPKLFTITYMWKTQVILQVVSIVWKICTEQLFSMYVCNEMLRLMIYLQVLPCDM